MAASKAKTRRHSLLPVLLAALVLVLLLWQLLVLGGRISDAKAQAAALTVQVQTLTQANETLADEISRASDEELIKEIARSELGLVEPGEKVFYDQSR